MPPKRPWTLSKGPRVLHSRKPTRDPPSKAVVSGTSARRGARHLPASQGGRGAGRPRPRTPTALLPTPSLCPSSSIFTGHTWGHLDDGPGGQKPDLEAAAFLFQTREMFLGVAPAQAQASRGLYNSPSSVCVHLRKLEGKTEAKRRFYSDPEHHLA